MYRRGMKKNGYIFILIMTFVLPVKTHAAEKCGIENCHGLDITCGPNVPEVCTEMYGLGDFCRAFVRCEIVNGKCEVVKNPQFDNCRSCVEKCSQDNSYPPKVFECEAECRAAFQKP